MSRRLEQTARRFRMISIAYEATALAQSPFGGITQVCRHTLVQARRHSELSLTALYRHGDEANLAVVDNVPCRRWSWIDRLRPREYDIVHALCHRLPTVTGRKTVYTLYDAWSLTPNRYQSRRFQMKIGARMERQLRKADAILAISEWTRDQLLKLDLVDPNRCRVALIGADRPPTPKEPSLSRGAVNTESPFALFVGRLEVRKNLPHVIDAVLAVPGLRLVVVGEPGYGYDELARSHLSRLPSDRLQVVNHIPQAELDRLYHHAVATLLPSHEEGFGLPVLEAMIRGCPMITSNRSASAEVGAGAAILVDPNQPAQSTEALVRVRDDHAYRDRIVAAGLKRGGEFGWDKYFQTLIDTYHQLLG